jgi:hypothetical protein
MIAGYCKGPFSLAVVSTAKQPLTMMARRFTPVYGTAILGGKTFENIHHHAGEGSRAIHGGRYTEHSVERTFYYKQYYAFNACGAAGSGPSAHKSNKATISFMKWKRER